MTQDDAVTTLIELVSELEAERASGRPMPLHIPVAPSMRLIEALDRAIAQVSAEGRQTVATEPRPNEPTIVHELAEMAGGKIDAFGVLPDGSGFATMSMPLPADHWLTADDGTYEAPPMGLRELWHSAPNHPCWNRQDLNAIVRAAGRYAVRAATMKGKEEDFDPDAMVQNFVVGLLGYHTADGLSSDEWANPPSGSVPSAETDAQSPAAVRAALEWLKADISVRHRHRLLDDMWSISVEEIIEMIDQRLAALPKEG